MNIDQLKAELKFIVTEQKALTRRINALIKDVDSLKTKEVVIKRPKSDQTDGSVRSPRKGTAPDVILQLIKDAGSGIDVAALMDETGYDKNKVANSIFRLRKWGMIESPRRGVYVVK